MQVPPEGISLDSLIELVRQPPRLPIYAPWPLQRHTAHGQAADVNRMSMVRDVDGRILSVSMRRTAASNPQDAGEPRSTRYPSRYHTESDLPFDSRRRPSLAARLSLCPALRRDSPDSESDSDLPSLIDTSVMELLD